MGEKDQSTSENNTAGYLENSQDKTFTVEMCSQSDALQLPAQNPFHLH